MLTILFIIAELDRNKGRPMYQVEIDILYTDGDTSQVVKTLRLLSTCSYVSSQIEAKVDEVRNDWEEVSEKEQCDV